jgi:hypothetical protein
MEVPQMEGFTGMHEIELALVLQKWMMKDMKTGRTTEMLKKVIKDIPKVKTIIICAATEKDVSTVTDKLLQLLEEDEMEYTRDKNNIIVGDCSIDVQVPDGTLKKKYYERYYEDHTMIEYELIEFLHKRKLKRTELVKDDWV